MKFKYAEDRNLCFKSEKSSKSTGVIILKKLTYEIIHSMKLVNKFEVNLVKF